MRAVSRANPVRAGVTKLEPVVRSGLCDCGIRAARSADVRQSDRVESSLPGGNLPGEQIGAFQLEVAALVEAGSVMAPSCSSIVKRSLTAHRSTMRSPAIRYMKAVPLSQ